MTVRGYSGVLAVLLTALALNILLATLEPGRLQPLILLAVAFGQAAVVILFFMHVRHSPNVLKIAVGAGFFWLAILISFVLVDVLTRGWMTSRP